jgi:hypothetical protein
MHRLEHRREAIWTVAVGLGSLLLIGLLNLPFLSSYVVRGDDFALLTHSARFFSPSVEEWVLEGYQGYGTTFPELGEGQTNFIRPTINASVYLDSWVSPGPTSAGMLTTNYLGHAVATALVFLLGLRIFGLSTGASLIASSLFLTSSATTGLLTEVAYRGDMLAGVLAVGALLLMHSYLTGRPALWKPVATAVLLLLAAFAKEAAAAAPAVVGLYAILLLRERRRQAAGGGPRSRAQPVIILVALALPLVAYAAARLHAGLGGNYVLDELPNSIAGVPRVALNPLRFVLTAFLPPETDALKAVLDRSPENVAGAIGIARTIVLIGLNLLAWLLVVIVCRQPAERRRLLPLLGLGLTASALPLVLKAEPRFMYFGLALLLPFLVLTLVRARAHWRGERPPSLPEKLTVALLIVVGPLYFVAQTVLAQPTLVRANRTTADLQRVILLELRNPELRRLYLVDAPPTLTPGMPALEFLAALSNRENVALRVVNTFDDDADGHRPGGQCVELRLEGDRLTGTIQIGPSQHLFGAGVLTPSSASRLGQPGILTYAPVTQLSRTAWGTWEVVQTSLTFYIPHAARRDYAVVGLDPGEPGVHSVEPPHWRWSSGALAWVPRVSGTSGTAVTRRPADACNAHGSTATGPRPGA